MKMSVDGRRLCVERLEKGYSQSELAKIAGVSYATVNYLENNRTEHPRPSSVKRICDALNIKVSDIYKARIDS